jgi:flagellar hook-associated protein 1 FlgK
VSNTNAGTINEGEDTVTTAPATGAAVVPGSAFGGDLELKFTTASSYDVIDKASGTTVSTGSFAGGATTLAVAYPASSSAAGHYWQVNLTGAPRAGDVATLTPGGLNSGSNAQRMSDLWTRTDSALPGGSMQGSVLSLIGETGAASAQATTLASNTASNLNTAQGDLTRAAGVNVDQQATLLTEYQQAYQAAAKVISTAHSMFNSLLQAI